MRDPAHLLVRFPHAVVLAYLATTVLLGLAARNVRIEGSVESVLPRHDPAVQYYAGVRGEFGSDDIAVVGVRAPDVFTVATLTKIARVTDRLAALKEVERVVSVTNTVDPAEFATAETLERAELSPCSPSLTTSCESRYFRPSLGEFGGWVEQIPGAPLRVALEERGARTM